MESVKHGWVFLAPFSNDQAILQVMVPFYPDKNLDFLNNMVQQTSTIKHEILCLNDTIYVFQLILSYQKI